MPANRVRAKEATEVMFGHEKTKNALTNGKQRTLSKTARILSNGSARRLVVSLSKAFQICVASVMTRFSQSLPSCHATVRTSFFLDGFATDQTAKQTVPKKLDLRTESGSVAQVVPVHVGAGWPYCKWVSFPDSVMRGAIQPRDKLV